MQKTNAPAQPIAVQEAIVIALKELNSNLANLHFLLGFPQKEDKCDLIGKHIALQLRELSLPDMIDAKDDIQVILSKYRKTAYERNTSTPLAYSTSSPHPNFIPIPPQENSLESLQPPPLQPAEQFSAACYGISPPCETFDEDNLVAHAKCS